MTTPHDDGFPPSIQILEQLPAPKNWKRRRTTFGRQWLIKCLPRHEGTFSGQRDYKDYKSWFGTAKMTKYPRSVSVDMPSCCLLSAWFVIALLICTTMSKARSRLRFIIFTPWPLFGIRQRCFRFVFFGLLKKEKNT